ncbi:hypothetical protein J3F84DRAFT_362833 [Trichoderma pleuroticola]
MPHLISRALCVSPSWDDPGCRDASCQAWIVCDNPNGRSLNGEFPPPRQLTCCCFGSTGGSNGKLEAIPPVGIETSVIPVYWANLESRPLTAMLLGPGQPRQNSRFPSAVIHTLLAMSGLTPTTKERFCWLTGMGSLSPTTREARLHVLRWRECRLNKPLASPGCASLFSGRFCCHVPAPIPRVVTRQPSVSDALIHAKIPGWCCHALSCRFCFPPCLQCSFV